MEQTIEQLQQSKNWINEALDMLEKDTIDGYLDYFQVGYVSGNWHLPTIVTGTNYETHHRLAALMNEKLGATGFHIDEDEVLRNGGLVLFFEKEYIGVINLFKRTIYGSTDYQFKLEKYQKKKEYLFNDLEALEKSKEESIKWLEGYDHSFRLKGLFSQRAAMEHKKLLLGIDEKIQKEKKHIHKMESIYDESLYTTKAILKALPHLSLVMKEYGIAMEGYLDLNRKRYSFYQLIGANKDQVSAYISKNNMGGIYHIAPYVAFSQQFLSRFPIEDIREELVVKPYEVFQKNFLQLLDNENDLGIVVENLSFVDGQGNVPEYLKEKLTVALENKRERELSGVAKDFEQEGFDVAEVGFKLHGVNVMFNRFAEISILGEEIENKKILSSEPVRSLLGMK